MSQRSLFDFGPVVKKPVQDEAKAVAPQTQPAEATQKPRKRPAFPPVAPENLPPSFFVSATYDGRQRKAVIKLYEPSSGRIYFWYDNTGHKPYCLTNLTPSELEKIPRLMQHEGFDHFETEEKFDPLNFKNIKVTKIVTNDPLAIGGKPQGTIRDIIPEDYQKPANSMGNAEEPKVWEARIKYYQSYIYDKQFLPGMIFEVKNGNLIPVTLPETETTLTQIQSIFIEATKEEHEFIQEWARLLEYPAPKFRRAAIDIEVYSPTSTRVPDPREANYPVICCSLYSSDNEKKVLMLKREGTRIGNEPLPAGVTIEYVDSEEKLLKAIFDILMEYPFVVTFNGDDFDLRYLMHRAMNLGFQKNEVPIEVGKRVCLLRYGVHIDLYKFFYNRSIQIYAFNNRYHDVTLDDVGNALIGTQKIRLEKTFAELSYTELAQYCFRDSEIAYKLTSFEDELAMKLILVLARISSMPMEDV